jgi:uncharacterized protein
MLLQDLTQIILDFHEEVVALAGVRASVLRDVALQLVPRKATIVIGVRRCGKTTYLRQRALALHASGISLSNIVFINFFDDRLFALKTQGLGVVLDAYFALFPEKKGSEKVYFFFDEIQTIPHWENFIDRVLRTENCEVYVSGSSANLLSREIATSMRGRSLSWEMSTLAFREFLRANGTEVSSRQFTTKQGLQHAQLFRAFWQTGGFPEVLEAAPALRVRIHQEYLQALLSRDIIERHNISHPRALIDLVHRLLASVGSLYSLNRLVNYLHDLGHKVPKMVVAEYLRHLEDAYFLFSVRLYDRSLSRSNANPKKIYCIDHAWVRSVSSSFSKDEGHLLESLVFVALRRTGHSVHYYRTKRGTEVDFYAVPEQDASRGSQRPLLIQVAENLYQPETRAREIAALELAMAETKQMEAWIVTMGESARVACAAGIIHIVPCWKFLLAQDPLLPIEQAAKRRTVTKPAVSKRASRSGR